MFEQSGTFKNEFIKLGYQAEDYDIQDNFGQTDNVIDLFAEIDKASKAQEISKEAGYNKYLQTPTAEGITATLQSKKEGIENA